MIKIINTDGVSSGTIIKDEHGNNIKAIKSIDINFSIGEPVIAKLEVVFPLVETTAQEVYVIHNLALYPTKYLNELKLKIQEELGSRNDN